MWDNLWKEKFKWPNEDSLWDHSNTSQWGCLDHSLTGIIKNMRAFSVGYCPYHQTLGGQNEKELKMSKLLFLVGS